MFSMELNYSRLLNCAIISALLTFLFICLIDNKYKKTKLTLFYTSIVFYTLEAISFLTIMWDMNYAFLRNLFEPTNYIAAFQVYRKYTLLAVICVILTAIVITAINKYVKIKNKYIKYPIMLCCVLYLATPYSMIYRFSKTVYKIMYNPSYKMTYQELFKHFTGKDFVDKKDLQVNAENGKNLVFIYLESYEQNFLHDSLKDISANVRKLASEGEFYSNIPQIEGSSWTMAGIHTTLCGSPEIYSIRRNKLFPTVTYSDLICFSDVLHKAGYNQVYIGGEFRTFSGKYYFLNLHGYDKVYGDKEIYAEYPIQEKDRWGWGAKDKDVFAFAKIKYKQLIESGKPFNLTISTISPHAPAGIYDERCKNPFDNSTLNAIQCDDEDLQDFLDFIKTQPNYENTIIVLLPDHLLMSSNASDILNKIGNRQLYSIILNNGKNVEHKGEILYTDIPDIVLENLNIRHNALFLLHNYKNESVKDRVKFIENNVEKIRSFNNKTIKQE